MGVEMTRQDLINQGFSAEEIEEEEKRQRESSPVYQAGQNLSRIAGLGLGTANAPLAFIKGAMNAEIANPEEFKQMSLPGKMATQFAGGLESAWRSISKKGDWGEDYDTYYKHHSGGATLQDTFGEGGSMLVKLGLDLMMDPLFGPALAVDLARKGITSLPQFAKYLSKGAVPADAQLRTLTEGFPKTNLYNMTEADRAEMAALTEQERTAAINRLKSTLEGRKTELQTLADEEAAAQYGYSTLHGTATDETGVAPYLNKLKERVQGDEIAMEQIRSFEASLGDVDGPVVNLEGDFAPKPTTMTPEVSAGEVLPSGGIVQPGTAAPASRRVSMGSELADAMSDTPVALAIVDIKRQGGLNHKALVDVFGAEETAQIVKKHPGLVSKQGGARLDVIAADFGFESDVVLKDALMDKKSKKQIAAEAKASFDALYGEDIALAKKGFEKTPDGVIAGDLNKGDKIFMNDDTFKVKGYDEKGNVILEDGRTFKVDVFEQLKADGVKKAPGMQQMAGGVAGIEEDEEGNLTFDIKNGLLGMAAGVGAKGVLSKSSAGRVKAGMFSQVMSGAEKTTATKVAAMYDKTVAARAEREAVSWQKVRDFLIRGFVDRSGNLKREAIATDDLFGREMVMQQELHAGSSAIASNMNEQYQKAIFHGLSSNEQEMLNSVIQSKRIIAIDDYKGLGVVQHPDGLTGVEHLDYLAELERRVPEVYADLEARAGLYFDAMQEQLQYRLKEGLITQDQFAALSKEIYSPRQFMQHLDDSATLVRGGKKISVSERGGIHALDEGSMGLLENNAQRLLQYNVNMTQDMISRNKANRTLLDFVQANPGNEIATEANIVKYTKEGAPVYAETPAGHDLIRLYVDGKEKLLHMPKDMAQEWITADPLMNHTISTLVQWLSGTKLVKAFATGYNPAFALSNIPRDVALVWGSTDQYSKHLPIAMGQFARDFAAVAPDVFKRSGRVVDYVNEGGGTELLTYYGRLSQAGEIGEKVNNLGKFLGWVGETSEIWTRIALRERAMRNGLSAREATWQARHYLDFSQGGNIAKALDNAMPYLNAGIQGTRSIFRYAANEPGRFAYKIAQLGAISMGLYIANHLTNPETLAAVSDRDKEANFIITTPFTYTDKDGQLRRYYVKIPKDQGQRAFCTFFEGLMEAYYERKIPGKRMALALSEFVGMGSLPPVVSALMAYAGNKDTWNWQDVWRGPKDIEPGQEYTADTHPLAVAAGQVTNLSPERGTRALGSMMPPNNAWVGLVSGGLREITNSFNPKYEQETMEQMLLSNPTVRRFLSSTSEINRYRTDIDQIKTEEVTRRFSQGRELDKMTAAFFQNRDPAMGEKIMEYVANAPPEDQERLVNRVNRHSQTAQLPDGQWWRSVGGLPTSARAEAFLLRFESESLVGQARMLETAGQVSGFSSDNFIKACILLKEQGGPKRRGILPQLADEGELE